MPPFADELNRRLAALRQQGLYRELQKVDSPPGPHILIGAKKLLNFSSNDYLGLANHPALTEAAIEAIKRFGAGASASRLICGSLAPFHQLEEFLAAFKGTESALTFSTGYAAALGTITALAGKDDLVILDKRVHACIVDAARLSGAKLRVFKHNDLNDLEDKLKWAAENLHGQPAAGELRRNALVITESIFSMDGDAAPLREIVELKAKYGAWLMVDEAHATGVIGEGGRGLANALCVSSRIEIQMGTLGKALGASGGFICGNRALTDYLANRARSFIFSTAPVPAAAAAALAGLKISQSPEGEMRRHRLHQNIARLKPALGPQQLATSPILPIILGGESKALAAAKSLRGQNIFVPAIRYPTVARGAARLRVTLTADHSAEDLDKLVEVLENLKLEPSDLESRIPNSA